MIDLRSTLSHERGIEVHKVTVSISLKQENAKEQKYEKVRSAASRDFRLCRTGSSKDQLLAQPRAFSHLL
jgi:hypothetical protein